MSDESEIVPAEIRAATFADPVSLIESLRDRLAVSSAARGVANAVATIEEQQLAVFEAEAARWPTMRAAVVGSEDNQRHSLSHCHKVFGTLDLHPLEFIGLEALGLLGLKWRVEAAAQVGDAPAPILARHVLADPNKSRICRLVGAVVSWRHMKAVYHAKVAEFDALVAAGRVRWRSKEVTADQSYLLKWIQNLIQADEPKFELPVPKNRGEAFDMIREMGGSPAFRDETDHQIIILALTLILEIKDA